MKLAFIIALIASASFVQAKDRYLVVFKSQQGQKAMQSYLSTESGAQTVELQRSLRNVRSLVVKTQDKDALARLKNHPEVAAVEAEYFIPAPKPVYGFRPTKSLRKGMSMSVGTLMPPVLPPTFNPGTATPWGILAVHAGDAWAGSQAGAAARVMVLDSGIDADHPAIKANFEKAQNFFPKTKVKPSDPDVVDPLDFADGVGHGTHCSGTILGAYNAQDGFTGVAPQAKLLMGRVCGEEGCSSISIVEGINWGIGEKVDVISMSLGGGATTDGEKQVVQAADAAGVVIVAASGNGADEPDYSYDKTLKQCEDSEWAGIFLPFKNCGVGFPAALPTVIAVGAVDSNLVKTSFSQWGPELAITAPGAAVVSSIPRGTGRESLVELTIAGVAKKIKSNAFSGTDVFLTPVSNEIVAVPGVGEAADFAKVNVAGKFALVQRGQINFVVKIKNALAAKAAGVILYNSVDGLVQGAAIEQNEPMLKVPVVMIEKVEGEALVASLKAGVSTAAISTVITDYASYDGTSMATPHVAGVVALMKSANKNLTPAQVREILKATATPLAPNDTNQYGAGLVQADKAVAAALAHP